MIDTELIKQSRSRFLIFDLIEFTISGKTNLAHYLHSYIKDEKNFNLNMTFEIICIDPTISHIRKLTTGPWSRS